MTISYGRLPNEVFLVYFGFVPAANPYDDVVIFDTLADLLEFHNSLENAAVDSTQLSASRTTVFDHFPEEDMLRCSPAGWLSLLATHALVMKLAPIFLQASWDHCLQRFAIACTGALIIQCIQVRQRGNVFLNAFGMLPS